MCKKTSIQENISKGPFCLTDTLQKMIETSTVELQEVRNELKLSGKVTSNQDRVIRVFPPVSGTVTAVNVELGDYVQQGQVLAVMRSAEIAAFGQQVIIAEANLLIAQRNLKTAQDMFASGLTSERDKVTAEKEVEKAQAELNRTRELARIYNVGNGSEYIIRAPSSGFVIEKNINKGMLIRSDNTDNIFTISDLNDVWVTANVYEADISKIKEGYEADITILSYPDKVFKGKIDKINSIIDPATRVLKVRIKLDNPKFLLKPDMFASVKVYYTESQQMLTVPVEAVIMDNNKHYVLKYEGKCKISIKEVEIYKQIDKRVYLKKADLKAGDKVISKYELMVYTAMNEN
ncbi:MAG: efflux RND transporter periplasmic adaptor subunit [Microscillaceae bacterium]|nr:efflux RND transporter periplasmic adaptor subunit [Microscillaceae bacterium]MDW8460229.1 efflux RND transporter periplasmic adaptor subunit [Cytophagales bacterium]